MELNGLDLAAKALYDAGRPPRATAEHWNLDWGDPMISEATRDIYRNQVRIVLAALGLSETMVVVEWVAIKDGKAVVTRSPISDLPAWAQHFYR